MSIKIPEDIIPLTDIKTNQGNVVHQTSETHRPVLLTSRGVAVMQSLEDYEQSEEEKVFMRAIVEGLTDLDNKRQSSLVDVKKRLGLK